MAGSRYAIYWAPDTGHRLWREGSRWLGRDALSGQCFEPPSGVDAAQWQALTCAPRRYGFHATLKAPFALREERDEIELLDALRACVSSMHAFYVHGFAVATLSKFIALRPASSHSLLGDLANRLLVELDRFRQPLSPEVMHERRQGLYASENSYLDRWGYPYVFEHYRFHCTLADPVPAAAFDYWQGFLERRFSFAVDLSLPVDSVCLVQQLTSKSPFFIKHRIYFDGRQETGADISALENS